jgi:hypothetical protein
MHTKTWKVEIFLSEDEATTRAEAVLHTTAGTELRHTGVARRSPEDANVPEIGDELAVCRALAGLSHALFDAAVMDVEENTGAPPAFIQ